MVASPFSIIELTCQPGDITPLDVKQTCGIGLQAQGRVLDALDFADVGDAIIGRGNVDLVVAGSRRRRCKDQHEANDNEFRRYSMAGYHGDSYASN